MFSEYQLMQARKYAAKGHRQMAEEVFTADYYADHVTLEMKKQIREEKLKLANDIEQGLCDGNLTVAQNMRYYLTGECHALLP